MIGYTILSGCEPLTLKKFTGEFNIHGSMHRSMIQ